MERIKEEIIRRNLPPLMVMNNGKAVQNPEEWKERREEIGELLRRDFSGFPPRLSVRTSCETLRLDRNSYGGKAVTEYRELRIRSDYSEGRFPFTLTVPKGVKKAPLFLFLSFTPTVADGIGEEILDRGYAIANVFYQDMAADYFDGHATGLGRFCTRNPFDSWGKLEIWAWGARRMLDVLEGDPRLDSGRMAVMGHSRLGKAALLAGAFDTRFSLTVSCQSGGGGAALFRGKTGEQLENLYGEGSRLWFDGNFFRYRGRTEELPFDQHFLLAMIAPRHLYVSSATEDDWADPESEFLSCAAASAAWECHGLPGLIRSKKESFSHHVEADSANPNERGMVRGEKEGFPHPGEADSANSNERGMVRGEKEGFPHPGEALHEGHIGYHLRAGTHYLSREDWRLVMDYREKHGV